MTTHTVARDGSPLAATLETFFETKTACDVEGTMAYFSPDLATYIDATLGWDFDSYEALKAVFAQYMPNWSPPARSYATRVLANETSALVNMVDTPELFGGELRILAAIDFVDGKIVRWVDYWDSSSFDDDLYAQFRTPADAFPRLQGLRSRHAGRARGCHGGNRAPAGVQCGRRVGRRRPPAHRRRARGHGASQSGDRSDRNEPLPRTDPRRRSLRSRQPAPPRRRWQPAAGASSGPRARRRRPRRHHRDPRSSTPTASSPRSRPSTTSRQLDPGRKAALVTAATVP